MAAKSPTRLEVCTARPGLIVGKGEYLKSIFAVGLRLTMGVPSINIDTLAAAILHEVVEGFASDLLRHEDLAQIGGACLSR